MLIARVIGELVATQKHSSHEGCKLLLVQPLNLDGYAASSAVGRPQSPIDMAVIGFIDEVEILPGVA